ncbi:hypothetical protein ACFSE0_11125 [Ochrobactrum teleogrylli]|uniref:Uncharacterized protein n=1 Tax=Ochrobactrum teleogrylli TaxID=2479765 RepID=A0ABY2XY70_9HYPH|nr:hypothetical protein [[Ochrobactrum] teleogrylli]TNV09316.1 hypothetical protein FIC94_22150 [[Ochrobactrum] teleogrylli]
MSDDINNDMNIVNRPDHINGVFSMLNESFFGPRKYLSVDLTDPDAPIPVLSEEPFYWQVMAPVSEFTEFGEGNIFYVREDGAAVFIQPGPKNASDKNPAILTIERRCGLYCVETSPTTYTFYPDGGGELGPDGDLINFNSMGMWKLIPNTK